MKKIHVQIDHEKSLTVLRVAGKPAIEDYVKEIRDYYKRKTTTFILWDFTQADVSSLSSDELRRAIKTSRKAFHSRMKGKTAFVFSTVHGFGLGRMMEAFGELEAMPVEFRTFRSLKAAYNWLDVEPLPDPSPANTGCAHDSRKPGGNS